MLLLGLAAAAAATCGGDEARPRGMSQADYDRWRRPERVVAHLELEPGFAVADVGAGRGYLTFRIARAVGPRGRVTATDIDPEALAALTAAALGRPEDAPVTPRLVRPDDPGLEAGAYDRILLAQVDHYLPDRVDYLRRLAPALAPGGRLAIENRIPHRAALMRDAAAAGWRVVAEAGDLPGQFLVLFAPPRGHP